MLRFLPLGGLEIVLLVIVAAIIGLVVRSVRRRHAFVGAIVESELPDLSTDLRLKVTLRRLWRDPEQGLPLAEVAIGGRKFVCCPTDHAKSAERYNDAVGKTVEIGLYGLATLAEGGVEAMREQIRNAETMELGPDFVSLIHQGQFANDYVVIGRVLSHREDNWDDAPLTVYRVQAVRADDLTLTVELAAPRTDSESPFPPDTMIHGSARLFGYLA